jgi:hypothetical protein
VASAGIPAWLSRRAVLAAAIEACFRDDPEPQLMILGVGDAEIQGFFVRLRASPVSRCIGTASTSVRARSFRLASCLSRS